jgi:superfamily II DNA or RNA helicase
MIATSGSACLPPMRDWQHDACDFAHQHLILDGKEHVYIVAPTGTGKSRFSFEAAERLPIKGSIIIMVGLGKIVVQHRESLIKFGCVPIVGNGEGNEFISPSGRHYVVDTWQAFAAKSSNPYGSIAILVFDECQIGGTHSGKSFRKIVDKIYKPAKRINVSATIQGVDTTICGTKAGHTYQFTLNEAYEADYLHPVDLVEVHTGVNIQVELTSLENATGMSVEDLQDLTSNDLQDLAAKCQDRGVGFDEQSLSKLVRQRHESMILTYIERHLGEQAIFYSTRIEQAELACRRFNALVRRKVAIARHSGADPKQIARINVRAQCVHSNEPNSLETIERFERGEIAVLFVVGMLQEGFDKWDLRLAFDCRFYRTWNEVSRIARFIQKVGRLMRIPPTGQEKPPSYYYYARDLTHFYDGSSFSSLVHPGEPVFTNEDYEANPEDTTEDPSFSQSELDASVFAGSVRSFAEGMGNDDGVDRSGMDVVIAASHTVLVPVSSYDLPDGETDLDESDETAQALDLSNLTTDPIRAIHTPLLVLREATGERIVARRSYISLFGNDAERKRAELERMAAAGEPAPNQSTPLGRHLAFQRGSKTDWFVRLEAQYPEFLRGKHALQRKMFAYFEDLALKGLPFPLSNSKEAKYFYHQKRIDTKWYREFNARYPNVYKTFFEEADEKQRICEKMAAEGQQCPPAGTEIGNYLRRQRNRKTAWYTGFQKRYPDFGDTVHTRFLRKQQECIALAEAGGICPVGKTELGSFFKFQKHANTQWYRDFISKYPSFKVDHLSRRQDKRKEIEDFLAAGGAKLQPSMSKLLCYDHRKNTPWYQSLIKKYPHVRIKSPEEVRAEHRAECLQLAEAGISKPPQSTSLGRFLYRQAKANTPWYRELRKQYPEFEITIEEAMEEKKKAVRDLARSGKSLPPGHNPLRNFFSRQKRLKTDWYQKFYADYPMF